MLPTIEVVIINWKRPENVAKIIEALKAQTIPCTITVCDCHNQQEFSLSKDALELVDRIYRWKHNLGPFSRYVPLAAYDHYYTFFIDDDILPGNKCLETFLQAALIKSDFAVLGQMARVLGSDGSYNLFPIQRAHLNDFVEVDFIIRAYFVKSRYLHNLVKFRWQIGYHEEIQLQDDLLMCASIKFYENLNCYLIPSSNDLETRVNKVELNADYAFSSNVEHFDNRQDFVNRIIYHGWKHINRDKVRILENQSAELTGPLTINICLIAPENTDDLKFALEQIYNWDICDKILVVGKTDPSTISAAISDPKKKVKFMTGKHTDIITSLNDCTNEITGSHLLVLDSYEYYSAIDLQLLKEDIINNPNVDLFKFNFSQKIDERNYFHLWQDAKSHITGSFWDIPQNRIYKWKPGSKFEINQGIQLVRPNSVVITYPSPFVSTFTTRAKCINACFARENGCTKSLINETLDIFDEHVLNLSQKDNDIRVISQVVFANVQSPPNTRIFNFPHKVPQKLIHT